MTKIYNIKSKQGQEVAVEINILNKRYDLFFKTINGTNINLSLNNEVIGSMLLMPLMQSGINELNIEGATSNKFLDNLGILRDIYSRWYGDYDYIDITGTASTAANNGNRVGTFFSGGVDSFYTLLKNKDEITDLIFIHGFDIQLEDASTRYDVSKTIHKIARESGKNLIEVETNLREILVGDSLKWGECTHGAALATTGHMLYEHFSKIFIPSTHDYGELLPWGSHPLTDPLWSSDSLSFIHDGCESNRVEKIHFISKQKIVLDNLRVCWENPGGAYNCGKCGKCLRTMVALKIYDALDKCSSFNNELDYNLVSKMLILDENTKVRIQENIDALQVTGKDKKLEKALNKAINKLNIYKVIKPLIPNKIKSLIPWQIKIKLRALLNKCLW